MLLADVAIWFPDGKSRCYSTVESGPLPAREIEDLTSGGAQVLRVLDADGAEHWFRGLPFTGTVAGKGDAT